MTPLSCFTCDHGSIFERNLFFYLKKIKIKSCCEMGLNAWLPAFRSESLITNIINAACIIECKWSVHTWWYFLTCNHSGFDEV